MRRSRAVFAVCAVSLALTGGCASTSSAAGADSGVAGGGSASSTAAVSTGGAIPVYAANRDADADIAAALATAAQKHQEVLVDFGANWCPDCVALDEMFHSPQVEPVLTRNYVVVAVDVGNWNLNLDVAGRYLDLQSSGIPALVVLAPDGKVVTTTNDGSFSNARSMAPSDVAAFLSKWAPSVSQ